MEGGPPVNPVPAAGGVPEGQQQPPQPPEVGGGPAGQQQPPPHQQPPIPGHLPPPYPPAPVIRTYQEFFSTASKDPHAQDYTDVSLDFLAPVQGASRHGPAALGARVVAASQHDIPMAMVRHCRDAANAEDIGVIQVFIRVSEYPQTILGPAQPWDGHTYALVGDIVNGQFTIVPFPVNEAGNFALAAPGTHVLEDEAMVAHIVGHPDGLVPHVAQGGEHATEVRTRLSTFLPFAYVPLLLPTALTPKQAFTRVLGMAQANNQVNAVRPLLDFLKVSSTEREADSIESATVRPWPTLPQPPNEALLTFFERKVNTDLPDRETNRPRMMTQFGPVVQAIDNLTDAHRQQLLDSRARQQAADRGKTPQQFYGPYGVGKLMRLCRVYQEGQLPLLWERLAGAPKTGRMITVQNTIDEIKEGMGVYFDLPISVSMVTKLVSLSFAGANQDDLSLGVNPFLFGLPTPEQSTQVAQQRALYAHIHGGGAAPSLADTIALEAPDDVRVATTIGMLQHTLDAFRVVMAAMLGSAHEVVVYLNGARRAMDVCAGQLAVQAAGHPTLPTLLQRYIQVEVHHWFLAQERSMGPAPFTAQQVIYEAAKGNMYSWRYELPAALTPRLPGPAGPPTNPPTGALPPPARPTPAAGANQIVRNEHYDTRFDTLRNRPNVSSREVKRRCADAGIALPQDDGGATRCLPFHIKGQCNSNCGCASDHHNRHTEEAQARLLEWAEANWTAA